MKPRTMATTVSLSFAAIAVVALFRCSRGADEPTPAMPSPVSADRIPTEAEPVHDGTRATSSARVAATAGTQRPFPPDALWFALRVVDKATQRPVPGATVFWYDGSCGKEYFASLAHRDPDPSLESLEQRALAFGWQTTTDDAGIARLASSEGIVAIAAAHEGRYGELSLFENSARPTAGVVLEIVPDHTLRVRVLDDRGAPAANVRIGFGSCDDARQPLHVSSVATTDANGIAEIRHLQHAVAWHRLSWHEYQTAWSGPLGVFILVPGNRTPGVVLTDLDPPPAAPIELRLPPYGSIVVRLAAVAADLPPVTVSLDDADGNWRYRVSKAERRTDASGSVRFDNVGLNRRFTVEATPGHWPETGIDGPSRTGQEVVVELRPDATLVRALGRLLLTPDQPAADQDVEVTETRSDWTMSPSTIRTDGDGRFVLMRSAPHDNQHESQLRFECTSPAMEHHHAEARRLLRPGLVDLGDVLTSKSPLLCSGRLVRNGAPFTKPCNVGVEHFDAERSSWQWSRGQRWLRGDDGTFTVTGDDHGARLRLSFSGVVLPKDPIEFPAGATGLVIEVDPGSTLAASLLVPEMADWHSLRVRLVPEPPLPAPASDEGSRRCWSDLYASYGQSTARRHAWWRALAAGSYTFEVWSLATGTPVLRIPGIRVPAATADERLHDIDLRTAVAVVDPRLLDEDGTPRLADVVMAAEPTGDRLAAVVTHRGIVLPTSPVDLTILVDGYRPTRAHFDGTRCEGRLTPWSTVELSIGKPPALPPGFEVRATVTAIDPVEIPFAHPEGSQWIYRPYAPDDATHTVTGITRVPVGDGRSSLSLELHGPRGSQPLAGAMPRTIEPGTHAVTVTVPEQAWTDALAQLQKD